MSKPLSCKLGLHRWFIDSALISSAECCDKCGTYKDPLAEYMLKKERKAWEEGRMQIPPWLENI